MALTDYLLDLAEVKAHLKVEHSEDDELIAGYAAQAIEEAYLYMNRNFEGEDVPVSVHNELLDIVAWRYEHRGDDELPPKAKETFDLYRFLPGL